MPGSTRSSMYSLSRRLLLSSPVMVFREPILEEINEQGSADTCLCYTEDDIFGILYYLTGNCHINWTVYDLHSGI